MDLKRNGSGYYDPTAYEALKNYQKEVERMSIKRGEIYVIELPNGKTVNGLIVSSDERNEGDWMSVICLSKEPKGINPVAIKCGVMQYADCDRISFIGSRNIFDFIRVATDAEMQEIDRALIDSLGLTVDAPNQPQAAFDSTYLKQIDDLTMKLEGAERDIDEKNAEITDLCEKLKVARMENKKLFEENVQLSATANKNRSDEKDAIKLMAERDLYKQQYETLLEKVIAR